MRTKICVCGKRIVFDDDALSIAHEDPSCDFFNRCLERVPPSRSVEGIAEKDLDGHFREIARRRGAP